MELSINVFKKEGAKKVPIRKTNVIRGLEKYKKINSHGLEEIELDMEMLTIQGSGSFAERVDEIITEYSLNINKFKLMEEAIKKCKKDYICRSYIPSEAQILNKLYNRITSQNELDPEKAHEESQAIYEATMNPIKDDLNNYYHKFLTETEKQYFQPNTTDLLIVSSTSYELNKTAADCLDLPKETSNAFVFQNETGLPKGVIRPDFVFEKERYVFVDQEGAEAYKKIYDQVYKTYDSALRQFNFELIVYDETEYFRDAGEEGFDYPYSN